MFRHLLVPLDVSEFATHLAEHAVAYAASVRAHITFFHAVADYGATDAGALERTLAPEIFGLRPAEQAEAALARAEAIALMADVPCSRRWRISDRPYEAIVAAAEEYGCDLIFIASHGRRGLDRSTLGSQTTRVLAVSRLPVLVVRGDG